MKIEIKYNIDFKRILKEVEQNKLTTTLNEGVSDKFAKNSYNFISSGKVTPALSDKNPRKIQNSSAKPLFDTGKLANSLKGNSQGIFGVHYAKDHLKEDGYKFKGLPVPQRKFITADLPTEKTANNKIYKGFQDKFIKLLNKRLRKK